MHPKTSVIVGVLFVLALNAAPGTAQSGISHQGQKVRWHVTLVGGGEVFVCEWNRLRADGELQAFSVPEGTALVITDVESSVDLGKKFSEDPHTEDFGVLSLRIWLNSSPSGPPVFLSSSVSTGAAGQVNRLGTNDQLSSGFVVKPDTPMCAAVEVSTFGGSTFQAAIDHIVLRGYVMLDPLLIKPFGPFDRSP